MFSSILRSQARLSLRTVARAAVPASRSLSSLVLRQAVVAPVVSRLAVARAFSSGSVLAYEREQGISPPSETIYVGNMPWDMTQEDLQEFFSEFGAVESARVQTGSDGRPRGFGHVTFTTVDGATAAITSAAEEPLHVGGRDLKVDYARRKGLTTVSEPNQKLYFSRFSAGENALRDLLSEFKDEVTNIYYMRDGNTGERLNAGFIEFADQDTATEALNKLNGVETVDGTLNLSYARPRRTEGGGFDRRGPASDRRYPNRSQGRSEGRSGGSRSYQSRGNSRDY